MQAAGGALTEALHSTGDQPFSPRQHEVADLVAGGLTNREIAGALHVSVRTAENHIQHIMTALGFRTRSQTSTWGRPGQRADDQRRLSGRAAVVPQAGQRSVVVGLPFALNRIPPASHTEKLRPHAQVEVHARDSASIAVAHHGSIRSRTRCTPEPPRPVMVAVFTTAGSAQQQFEHADRRR